MITLTVIAPAYNQEQYVVQFLNSLHDQTYQDYQLIIMDDHSTDNTAALIEAATDGWKNEVIFIQRTKNVGEGKSCAERFSRAGGQIWLKVDPDSLLPPETLQRFLDSFACDQVGMVGTLIRPLGPLNLILRGTEVLVAAKQRNDRQGAGTTRIAYGTCFAFRRDLFTMSELASRADADLSQLAIKRGWKVVLLEDLIVRTRFPTKTGEVFQRGRLMAHQELLTCWHHPKLLLTHWSFWSKIVLLGLLSVCVLHPFYAMLGLILCFLVTQIFLGLRASDYSLCDRIAGWWVTVLRWSGFDFEMILVAVQLFTKTISHWFSLYKPASIH